MLADLTQQAVIITGANKGIGRSIAKVFAAAGANLMLHGRCENELQTLCQNLRNNNTIEVNYFVGDMRDEDKMNQLAAATVECYGKINSLIHNAGIYPLIALDEMSLSDWQNVIDVNLTGTFLIVKATLPYLKQQENSSIVIVSSISGPKVGCPGLTHYCASKAGVNGFIRSAAIEFAKFKIRINGVEPGNIATEGLDDLNSEHTKLMEKAIPMGRLGKPIEIANTCLFLGTEAASFITGQTMVVDGGQILPESHFLL